MSVTTLPDRIRRGHRMRPMAVAGLVIIAVLFLLAAVGGLVLPDPLRTHASGAMQPPSADHWLGTDRYGRDVLSRTVAAVRIDLFIGLVVAMLSMTVGTLIGLLAGYVGGTIDEAIMRCVDVLMAFPSFVLAIILVAVLGDSVPNVLIAVAIGFLPYFVRLTRVEVLRERELDYVTAAQVVGNGRARIALRHLMPNVVGPSLVQATLVSGWAILNASGLAFLGIGIRPPTPEWGVMVAEGANDIITGQWWTSLVPGAMILVAVMAFHLVGDDLRGKQW
jgi:peptide/nickel transport system permease protein